MNIICYDDNPDFGGHQIMAVHAADALASASLGNLSYMLNPANAELVKKAACINSCQIVEAPGSTVHLPGAGNLLNYRGVGKLARLFKALDADLILCIQGNIEQCSTAVLAAGRSGIDCISYIALPHRMATIGAKLGGFRDRANRCLLNKPTRYITISDSMSALLREQGVDRPVAVVPNGIPLPENLRPGSPDRLRVLGMFGRIEFNQKQHDFMLQAFCNCSEFKDCRLVIAGDGPDRDTLKQHVARCPRKDDILILPWQQDIDAYFQEIDLLVIPSRYEGVPLVMLEALARGIPVIGSNRDGMRDLLPDNWTFDAQHADALAQTFLRVRDSWKNDITAIQNRVLAEHTLDAFKRSFVKAVLT